MNRDYKCLLKSWIIKFSSKKISIKLPWKDKCCSKSIKLNRVDFGSNINFSDSYGYTALHRPVERQFDIINRLIAVKLQEHGGNLRTTCKETRLHLAAKLSQILPSFICFIWYPIQILKITKANHVYYIHMTILSI